MDRRKEMDTLYLVIPAYNEQDTIETVIEEWYTIIEKADENSRLVVINDGSKDHTFEIMQKCAKEKPKLIALTKENGGHGATVLYGYHYAIEHHADYIFQTDSDGQTRPEEFPAFWRERKNYDMIIGYRNHRQDGLSRIFVTKMLKLVLKLCFGVWITDANTPFRLMKADELKKHLNIIPKNYNLPNVIISVIYKKKKLQVKYIPITFRPRQGGVNSINFKKIVHIGIQAVKDFRYLRKRLE